LSIASSSQRKIDLTQQSSLVTIGSEELDWQVIDKEKRSFANQSSTTIKRDGFIFPVVHAPRAGTAQIAREKGFTAPGWTAFFCPSKRRWLIWAPDGSYFVSLGSARAYETNIW